MNLRRRLAAAAILAALAALISVSTAEAGPTAAAPATAPSISMIGRSFEGPHGVTATYSLGNVVVAYSVDRYWVWSADKGWFAEGLLQDAWQDAPPYNLNFSSFPDERRSHRPFSYPGVSAAFFMNGNDELYIVSHTLEHGDVYWKYSFTRGWVGQPARLATLLRNAPAVDGMFPFGVGITGAWRTDNILTLISRHAYWRYDLTSGTWVGQGRLADVWGGAQPINGLRPYDADGVTATYYYEPEQKAYIISRDKYWVFDYKTNTWPRYEAGYLVSKWTSQAQVASGVPTAGTGRALVSKLHDICLDYPLLEFNRHADASLMAYPCQGTLNQKWTYTGSAQLRSENGRCIALAEPWAATGAVVTTTCNDVTPQKWEVTPDIFGANRWAARNYAGTWVCLWVDTRIGYGLVRYAPCAADRAQSWQYDKENPNRYVGLGDSYAAGTGAGNYPPAPHKPCYNSANSYAARLNGELAAAHKKTYSVVSPVACNGAWTSPGYQTPQTEQGYTRPAQREYLTHAINADYSLGAVTSGSTIDLVTVSIGGNDLGFADYLFNCNTFVGNQNCEGKLDEVITKIRDLRLKLVEVYRDIARRAPLAQIRIVNYPQAVSPSVDCRLGLSPGEAELFHNAGLALNREILRSVDQVQREVGTRIRMVDVFTDFEGHDACARIRDPLNGVPWMNGARVPWPGVDVYEFFHPNADGHAAMARLIAATL